MIEARQIDFTLLLSDENLDQVSRATKQRNIALLALYSRSVYGSVSAGREFWPFRVIFFQKVERSCGQTVKDRFDFSIDLGQLCLVHPRNTFVWPQKNFWSRSQHPYFSTLSHFWVKIRALMRPNLQGWTGFDLLIILGVKF